MKNVILYDDGSVFKESVYKKGEGLVYWRKHLRGVFSMCSAQPIIVAHGIRDVELMHLLPPPKFWGSGKHGHVYLIMHSMIQIQIFRVSHPHTGWSKVK